MPYGHGVAPRVGEQASCKRAGFGPAFLVPRRRGPLQSVLTWSLGQRAGIARSLSAAGCRGPVWSRLRSDTPEKPASRRHRSPSRNLRPDSIDGRSLRPSIALDEKPPHRVEHRAPTLGLVAHAASPSELRMRRAATLARACFSFLEAGKRALIAPMRFLHAARDPRSKTLYARGSRRTPHDRDHPPYRHL